MYDMILNDIFFKDWYSLLNITVTTILVYVGIIIILRVSGKRTLSKMNAFDFIVTVALGSCLGSIALTTDIPIINGLWTIILLVSLQYIITLLSAKYPLFKKKISSDPTLLFFQGDYLHSALQKERITKEEVLQTLRMKGYDDVKSIEVIILEATGDISVIKKIENISSPVYERIENV